MLLNPRINVSLGKRFLIASAKNKEQKKRERIERLLSGNGEERMLVVSVL
jgi:hypothetical protein